MTLDHLLARPLHTGEKSLPACAGSGLLLVQTPLARGLLPILALALGDRRLAWTSWCEHRQVSQRPIKNKRRRRRRGGEGGGGDDDEYAPDYFDNLQRLGRSVSRNCGLVNTKDVKLLTYLSKSQAPSYPHTQPLHHPYLCQQQ